MCAKEFEKFCSIISTDDPYVPDDLLRRICQFKDDLGRTALHICASKKRIDIMERLISQGAEVNSFDRVGNTPLHLAAISNSTSGVLTLLNSGARVEASVGTLTFPLCAGQRSPLDFVFARSRYLLDAASSRTINPVVIAEMQKISSILEKHSPDNSMLLEIDNLLAGLSLA